MSICSHVDGDITARYPHQAIGNGSGGGPGEGGGGVGVKRWSTYLILCMCHTEEKMKNSDEEKNDLQFVSQLWAVLLCTNLTNHTL